MTKAKTIGNVEAIQLAINNGATVQYDDVAQTPFLITQSEMKYMRYGLKM